ncbi:hypothetical protein K502DRAFT_324901 [Neoconidiobolus thromboides FSU 785]|nr:hypothetical protein K502DRAFT_324901 [Neoconidiobolus thromboides FSU 785]
MEAIRKNLPSRNTSIFFSIVFGLIALKQYDKRECINQRQSLSSVVNYLAERPLEYNQSPDKYVIFLHSPENELDAYYKAKEYFNSYIKPVWDAAAIDYDIVMEKDGGEIQRYVYEEIKKMRLQPNGVNLIDKEGSPILGWVALGKEAFGKLLSGIHDGASVFDPNIEIGRIEEEEVQTLDQLEEKKEKKVEKPKVIPAQQITSLLTKDTPRKDIEVPNTLPSLGYIRFHHYIGFTSTPLRIFEWFMDRKYVKDIGQEATVPLIGNVKQLNLPGDYFEYSKRDLRSKKIPQIKKEDLEFVKELDGKVNIYCNDEAKAEQN